MRIYVCYESHDRYAHVFGAAAWLSLGEAIAAIKTAYGPPYVVLWENDIPNPDADGEQEMIGHFSAVKGYSVEHDARFEFMPIKVDAEPKRPCDRCGKCYPPSEVLSVCSDCRFREWEDAN